MTKLLYIPNGEYIWLYSDDISVGANRYTQIYEESRADKCYFKSRWKNIKEYVEWLSKSDTDIALKQYQNIPLSFELSEIEIIYD